MGVGGGVFKASGEPGVDSCGWDIPVSLSESSIIMQSSVLAMK